MVNFHKIEEDAVQAVKDILHAAKANEPAAADAALLALGAVGVPAPLAKAVATLMEELLNHFNEAHPAPAAPVAPATPPAPAAEAAPASPAASDPAPAPVPAAESVPVTESAPAAADPFAAANPAS